MKSLFIIFFIAFLFIISGCATMRSRWQETKSRYTISAYEKFIAEYPDGEFLDTAKLQLNNLKKDIKPFLGYWKREETSKFSFLPIGVNIVDLILFDSSGYIAFLQLCPKSLGYKSLESIKNYDFLELVAFMHFSLLGPIVQPSSGNKINGVQLEVDLIHCLATNEFTVNKNELIIQPAFKIDPRISIYLNCFGYSISYNRENEKEEYMFNIKDNILMLINSTNKTSYYKKI